MNLVIDTFSNSYRNDVMLLPYWISWIFITLLILFSHIKDRPIFIRVCIHLVIIRNLVPWLNIEDRIIFDDLAKLIHWNQLQFVGVCGCLVVMSMKENAIIHLPMSITYMFFLSFAQINLFYQKSDKQNSLDYVFNNKMSSVIQLFMVQITAQYMAVFLIKYYRI